MTITYRTYMEKIPKKFRKLEGSCLTRPAGGLWGCRGDEWKEACDKGIVDRDNEIYPRERLKQCFEWKLQEGSKVYKIMSKNSFLKLVKNYHRPVKGLVYEIDYLRLSEDYDAVEVYEKALKELGNGLDPSDFPDSWSLNLTYLYPVFILAQIGLIGWDVPSICVLNTEKVEVIRKIKGE